MHPLGVYCTGASNTFSITVKGSKEERTRMSSLSVKLEI